jgi:putative SOS response-associated peptidase YedK
MCGRFTLILEPGDLEDEFDLGGIPEGYIPRYNIAPSQPVAAVRDSDKRQVEFFHWGLIPSWAKDRSISSKMINARAETLHEKPSFKTALSKRRNLIFTTGFFEWRKTGSSKEPLLIRLQNQRAFAFAGLWEEWLSPEGERIQSTTIITCPANPLIAEFHDRMPVILDKSNMWTWLDQSLTIDETKKLLTPYDSALMEYYPVTSGVNSPSFESPECIIPQPRLF